MHNIKEAIYENKKKLEGIGEDYQIQVGHVPSLGGYVAVKRCVVLTVTQNVTSKVAPCAIGPGHTDPLWLCVYVCV